MKAGKVNRFRVGLVNGIEEPHRMVFKMFAGHDNLECHRFGGHTDAYVYLLARIRRNPQRQGERHETHITECRTQYHSRTG